MEIIADREYEVLGDHLEVQEVTSDGLKAA